MITLAGSALLGAAPVLPLALIIGWFLPASRKRPAALLIIAPVPALLASVLAAGHPGVTFWRGLVPLTLFVDAPGAILLGVSSLLWIAGAVYVAQAWRSSLPRWQFATCWLLTLAGNIGVFIAADLASFFLAYTLVSLPAYGMIVQENTRFASRAGAVYFAYALVGETVLLMAFAFLAAGTSDGSLSIRDTVSALAASPWRGAAVGLLILGFGMKIALVPLHAWMPMTYRAAPIPAAAVLSGAGVKAGVIGLIRFLPPDAMLSDAGVCLTTLGFVGAFYGVALGLTKEEPQSILAYSSISQMGVIAALVGMMLVTGDATADLSTAFYAAHHVLVKGALFLAIGAIALARSSGRWLLISAALVIALGLGGLPITGGALAKLAVKGTFGEGVAGTLGNLSAAGTTLLMLHFVRRLKTIPGNHVSFGAPLWSMGPFLALTVASVLIPWVLYPLATGASRASVFTLGPILSSLWPVLVGTLLAILLFWRQEWASQLTRIDALRFDFDFSAVTGRCGAAVESAEARLRRWPAASTLLLLTALLLGLTLQVAR